MPIRFPEPPEEATSELRRTLRQMAGSAAAQSMIPPGAESDLMGGAERSLPHQVYSLALEDLLRGGGLKDAHLVSWRYFTSARAPRVTSAEVNVDPSGGHSFAQLNTGPFNEATLAAVKALSDDPALSDASYDFRLLRIPALYVTAVWLKSHTKKNDIVVPIGPTISSLVPGEQYDAAQFEDRVRAAAREKPSAPDVSASS